MSRRPPIFFFNETTTTDIYTLSLHDALPIFIVEQLRHDDILLLCSDGLHRQVDAAAMAQLLARRQHAAAEALVADRKSTRPNSSHANISYAVFCLQK